MSKFKVGDTVRITGNRNCSKNKVGDIGVIEKAHRDYSIWKVQVEGGPSNHLWTMEEDMELVVTDTPDVTVRGVKVGDRVVALRSNIDITKGGHYTVRAVDNGMVGVIDDVGDFSWISEGEYEIVYQSPAKNTPDNYTIILETLAGDDIVAKARLISEALK